MDKKERFFLTIERKPVDRPATWLGYPDEEALPILFKYFKVSNLNELKLKLGDDIYPVDVPYSSPYGNHIAGAFDFRKDKSSTKHQTLTDPGYFEDISDPALVDQFEWPDPSKYIDVEESRRRLDVVPKGYATMGMMWAAHFQDACSAFGMETALIKMYMEPEMFKAVIDKIVEFYLKANDVFYSATKGKLDAVLIGNDFGTQTGLLTDPDILRQHVFEGTRKLIDQAHSYNLKVIHHSCGSVFNIIPDLIEAGADSIHPIQALAKDMEPAKLKENYGSKVSFCGGIDAQELLIHGKPAQVKDKVSELKLLFPTGLIISPSHEAILPDIAPGNVEAIFEATR